VTRIKKRLETLNKNVTNNIPLNVYARHAQANERLNTQNQITAVVIDKVIIFLIISFL